MLTEVNDGYGDPVSRDDQLRQLVGDYKGWLRTMVRGVAAHQPWRHDDLVQEAYIAMWRGLDEWNGKGYLEGFLRQKARWRVQSLVRGDGHHYTGHVVTRDSGSQKRGDETRARIKGFIREYTRTNGRAPSMAETGKALGMAPQSISKQMKKLGTIEISDTSKAIVEAYRTTSLELLMELGIEPLSAAERFDEIELAYHYGEIHKAITELPDHYREYVWLRFWGGLTDAQAVRSVQPVYRGEWVKQIKPELADRLAHLSGIY